MSLNRFYKVFEMGFIPDELEEFDLTHHYEYTGTLPAWFNKHALGLLFPDKYYPTFDFLPPEGTSGTFTFGVKKYLFNTGTLVDTGIITINVQEFVADPYVIDFCNSGTLVWIDPSGGWESYTFFGKQQAFQDGGSGISFINGDGEKRWQSRDGVHQGVMQSTGNINRTHSDFIADLFKSVQVYLMQGGNVFVPIIIDPNTFRKPKSRLPFARYEFEFRYAVEDVIQTQ